MSYDNIPAEKFRFVQRDETILDKPPETKPRSFWQSALRRFVSIKTSVLAVAALVIIMLYSIIVPAVFPKAVTEHDNYYAYSLPKLTYSELGFWDGCSKKTLNTQRYDLYSGIPGAIKKTYGSEVVKYPDGKKQMYTIKLDSYAAVGFKSLLVSAEEYEKLKEYESSSGIQVMYPIRDTDKIACEAYGSNENAWFLTDERGIAVRDENGELQDIFLHDSSTEDGLCYALEKHGGELYELRVLYDEYYNYLHGKHAKFIFGADEFGYDIFVRLASGGRISLSISVGAALLTLIIGIIIGAVEGYYGGAVDMVIERFKDIIYSVPTVIFMTLFQLYVGQTLGSLAAMFLCFVFFGWVGISSTVRAQFYRFKNREYVLASKTLGAKDRRLIFRHILPNASGFIITSVILTIPGVIFGEATYSYLGIVNLNSTSMTSIGTMLENGQSTLSSYPHCVFFPALMLSIMLICANSFGNGLRDAIDPTSKH